MQCYCNSKKEFDKCCKPIISETHKASTAEELMRSRYSAYVLANIHYLLNSHHITTRPTKERKNILNWTKSVRWMGLTIIAKEKGTELDTEGTVEFKALYEQNGQLGCIHEKSLFLKEQGIWYYKSGSHK